MYINSHDISTIEYKGHISLVLFFEGCSERCSFCFNPELFEQKTEVSISDIERLINLNMPFIDAVVLTGGEPTEQADACYEIAKLAKQYNLKVKLNTNGVKPCKISQMIGLIDAVRLDWKPWKEQKMKRSLEVIGDKLLEIAYAYKEGNNEPETVDRRHIEEIRS